MTESPSVSLTSSISINQMSLRRSRRNRRNRTNRGQRVTQFENKTIYKFKKLSCGLGCWFLEIVITVFDNRRASAGQGNQSPKECSNFRTESQNYTLHCFATRLPVSLWDHDMFMDNWQFGPHNDKMIIEYLQTTYGKYVKYCTTPQNLLCLDRLRRINMRNEQEIFRKILCGIDVVRIGGPQSAKIRP